MIQMCMRSNSQNTSLRLNIRRPGSIPEPQIQILSKMCRVQSADVEEDADGQGIKWSFSMLRERLAQLGHDPNKIWGRINDLVIRTLIAVEEKINMNMNMYVPHKGNCYELFGFDVMLDKALHPWIIEVIAQNPTRKTSSRQSQSWLFFGRLAARAALQHATFLIKHISTHEGAMPFMSSSLVRPGISMSSSLARPDIFVTLGRSGQHESVACDRVAAGQADQESIVG